MLPVEDTSWLDTALLAAREGRSLPGCMCAAFTIFKRHCYCHHSAGEPYKFNAEACARRAIKNKALSLLLALKGLRHHCQPAAEVQGGNKHD
jgi:hypothetical protein